MSTKIYTGLQNKNVHLFHQSKIENNSFYLSTREVGYEASVFSYTHKAVIYVFADSDERSIRVELCQPELWEAFHRLGTEMIITKTGRRMFPAVRVRISGLKKAGKYNIHMEFICVDKHKYRYVYHR